MNQKSPAATSSSPSKSTPLTESIEWLEPDGLGGYASGTAIGRLTRRYHALLLTATQPPAGRFVLVNGFDAWIETAAGRFALSTQRYASDVIHPDGNIRLESFVDDPWPTWNWRIEDGNEITLELCVPHEVSACVLAWRVTNPRAAARLYVRPFLSGRDYHSLHRENPAYRFDSRVQGEAVTWKPYDPVPATTALSNGQFQQSPDWFRSFQYAQEQARGLDSVEDLASPGLFTWDLSGRQSNGREREPDAVLIFVAEGHAEALRPLGKTAVAIAQQLRATERKRRSAFETRLHRSADAYIVRGRRGKTIVAGYPWFTDWGRDTFISVRGLCLKTGRIEDAGDILTSWIPALSQGMLPNRFPDYGQTPEYNSVDASLWFIVAVHDYLQAAQRTGLPISQKAAALFRDAILQILHEYFRGTRYGIRCDDDGLLAAGVPGMQLTWMDAKVGDRVVTPRIGKPVEIQALWLCSLKIGGGFDKQWLEVHDRGLSAFRARFWNESRGCLYDVVDVDREKGAVDAALRPNQILAVGGLPWMLLDGKEARRVVDVVESRLWTPMGLRTLEPGAPGYAPHCTGGVQERDVAYHQGSVWPWLIGPFVEAWIRAREPSTTAASEAHAKFIKPLLQHLDAAGLGHISEIADGDPPHTPRGCPFQAWSLSELLRVK
jgi:predicted glycogen debranching enzyme